MKLVANSERTFENSVNQLRQAYLEKRFLRISYTTGCDRTIEQNAMFFALYTRISEALGDGSTADVGYWRAYCKLKFGVALLQIHDESFHQRWFKLVLTNPLLQSWEAQMDLMRDEMFGQDGFPVSRLFDLPMGSKYIDSIVRHFSQVGVFFEDLLDGSKKAERAKSGKAGQKRASCVIAN